MQIIWLRYFNTVGLEISDLEFQIDTAYPFSFTTITRVTLICNIDILQSLYFNMWTTLR